MTVRIAMATPRYIDHNNTARWVPGHLQIHNSLSQTNETSEPSYFNTLTHPLYAFNNHIPIIITQVSQITYNMLTTHNTTQRILKI